MDTTADSKISPPVIITPDVQSFPTKFRVKKVFSRTSLATDRLSCVSFLTSSHRSEHSACIPRWRSLPCNLEEEIFYDDCPDFLNAWSRYRITNMSRRYKTMDYIHMVLSDANSELHTELDVGGCDLSMTVGISVSRDLLNFAADYSEHGSGIIPRSASDDNLPPLDCDVDKQCSLTQANVKQCFAASRTEPGENLGMDSKKFLKIERWLRRCNSNPQGD